MSSNRFGAKIEPLRYECAHGCAADSGSAHLERTDLEQSLEAARDALCGADRNAAGAITQPERLLAEYQADRRQSLLAQILAAAKRLRDSVDRVVVLAGDGFELGAQALFGACCHPFHNELGRGDRGGRPRIYFDGFQADNDATQGLLDLLGHGRRASRVDDRWALIVVDSGFARSPTATALAHFLGPLRASCGEDLEALTRLIVPLAGRDGWLTKIAKQLQCVDQFADQSIDANDAAEDASDRAGGPASVFATASLFPAALMGLDLFQLLRGAAAMNGRFREAAWHDNPVLQFVADCWQLESPSTATFPSLAISQQGLESVRRWYDGWRPKNSSEPSPRRIQLLIDEPRRDRLPLADATPEQLGVHTGQNSAPAAIHLPHLDEGALGQFFQMMLLARLVAAGVSNDSAGNLPPSPAATQRYTGR